MIDKQSIVLGYYRQGKSKKQLSRELGFSLKTIKKYILVHQQEMQQAGLLNNALPKEGIIQPPQYVGRVRHKQALTEEVTIKIDEYLAQNKIKRGQGKHKQLMKQIDIHQALERAGHQLSYTSVRRHIRKQNAHNEEVFIRQHYEPGQSTEFDWGEVKVTVGGKPIKVMLAVFTSCYSNHRWAGLYHRQDMSSFLDTHARYFAYTGGVQREVVYDNMRTAVRKYTVCNSGKEPTEGLLKMSCYYQFDYRFCNARSGNEKGHVEKSVEYVRRKAFGPKDSFETIELANEHLLEICEQLNQKPLSGKTDAIQMVFDIELKHMKVPDSPYDASELVSRRVDKYSCIKVDTNWYSVPEGYVKLMLDVKIYPCEILVYNADNKHVATHVRVQTRYEYHLQIDHYLQTLHLKPGALKGSLTLQQADERLRHLFFHHFDETPRDFVEILLYLRDKQYSIVQFQQSIYECLRLCPHQSVSLDKIKILLMNGSNTDQAPTKAEDPMSKQIAQQCTNQLKEIQSLILS